MQNAKCKLQEILMVETTFYSDLFFCIIYGLSAECTIESPMSSRNHKCVANSEDEECTCV